MHGQDATSAPRRRRSLLIRGNPSKIAGVGRSFNPSQTPLEPLLPNPDRARPRQRTGLRPALLVALPLLLAGCRDTFAGFGAGPRARASAEQMFGALGDRHLDLARNARYEYSHARLAGGALSPSKVFDDTAAWTSTSGAVRLLETFGSASDGRYHMSSRAMAPAPARPGDGRHATTLSRLSDNEYRWDTAVDFALGSVRPSDIAAVITRLLTSGEGHTERDARALLAASAPRTSAALGTAFTLDTLRPVPLADGSTAVTVGISVHSDQLRQRYPAFGDYVRRYADPARYRLLVTDRAGVPFIEVVARDRFVTIRLRSQHGHLVPLAGPARPMPDSLLLVADFTVKVKMFTVGFHDLQMELVNSARDDQDRSWVVTARREPGWNLPFITARLLRAPLRRPFAGEGALFRIGVRAGEGSQPTVLYRQARLYVQESAILSFLNSLSSTAMEDLNPTVEREQNAWLREVFLGLREDARAALAP
ncbi:MAG: hypothetical protein JWN79_2143 [Gemmatimonadetes bacterium]|nr:hypothetical protein [Gemmatimonadota bacterium]